MLSYVSSLRLSSGHSGLVLTLSMEPMPPCSAPARWWQTWASGLLLCLELHLGAYSVGFFFSSQLCCHLRFQNSPQTWRWEGFLVFGNFFTFMTPSPGWVSIPNSCLSFYLLYFVLPPLADKGLPFWVSGVLCQRSEVVLWDLLSIPVIFWWICWGESGLPILFFHHLRTASPAGGFFTTSTTWEVLLKIFI